VVSVIFLHSNICVVVTSPIQTKLVLGLLCVVSHGCVPFQPCIAKLNVLKLVYALLHQDLSVNDPTCVSSIQKE